MEPKQIIMLIALLAIAFIGSGALIYIIKNLDKDEDGNGDDQGGHGGH
ncbi:MAG: hypothetical protein JJU11_05515 [Candidatus Sumerlaeia bacterium]|nr:hypothetical protein [Candidatus Sumerlaeia bacterium]